MKVKRAVLTVVCMVICAAAFAQKKAGITPSATYKFAQKDTSALYLDFYTASAGSQTMLEGKHKPTVIFIFGGGFKGGSRDASRYKPWFRKLTDNGYPVVSIDYRLGLKGRNVKGIRSVQAIDSAIHLGVEDLFSATIFLIDNSKKLGIDPGNMVVSGSSAGAIISMQAEYEICNSSAEAKVLPEGFNYAGVMSFAGAILSHKGKPDYKDMEPCPTLMLHGTKDKIVTYKRIRFFNLGFFGSCKITERFADKGYNYNTLRYVGHGHDIAERMNDTFPEQMRFLETNVIRGVKRTVDAMIDDPDLPLEKSSSLKEYYRK